jgi:hypothetical protein
MPPTPQPTPQPTPLPKGQRGASLSLMFTIEHEFDATVITLVDEGGDLPLMEDIVINAFEDCVTVEQTDAQTDEVLRITLSLTQLRDLAAALNLPEGSYRLERKA